MRPDSTSERLALFKEDFPKLREFDYAIPETWVRAVIATVGVNFADLARGTVWGYESGGSVFGFPIFTQPLPAAVYYCYLDIEEGLLETS